MSSTFALRMAVMYETGPSGQDALWSSEPALTVGHIAIALNIQSPPLWLRRIVPGTECPYDQPMGTMARAMTVIAQSSKSAGRN
jgi:hypothetical protein